MKVFDAAFVEANIFSGERIDTEHRQNLFQVVLGDESLTLIEAKDKIDKQIGEKNKDIATKTTEVNRLTPEGLDLKTFRALPKVDDVDKKIKAAEKRVFAASQSEVLQKLNTPLEVGYQLPSSQAFKDGFELSLATVKDEAIKLVKDHIANCMDERGEKWLEQGVGYHADSHCPFCGQSTDEIALVHAYADFFDKAYREHCTEVSDFVKSMEVALSDTQFVELRKTIQSNTESIREWNKYLDTEAAPSLDVDAVEELVKSVRSKLKGLLTTKSSNPLGVVSETEEMKAHYEVLAEANGLVNEYNKQIAAYQKLVDGKKQEATQADLQPAKAALLRLQGRKSRHEAKAEKAIQELKGLEDEKKALETKKKNAMDAIDKKSNEVIGKYQTLINEILERCGAEFSIDKLAKDYKGGKKPNARYALKVDDEEVSVENQLPGAPCFRNTLSSGDKTTLAFAFFAAMLKKMELKDIVVVIDDPISSMDYFREAHTCEIINDFAESAKQIIVMSHHAEFLCKLWKSHRGNNTKALEVYRTEDGSGIREWSIEEASRTEYEQNSWVVREFMAKGATGSLEDIARRLRPLLEDYLRFKYSGEFNEDDWLGVQIEKIRNAVAGSVLANAKPLIDELTAINEFSKEFHHGRASRQGSKAKLQETTLRTYAKRALDLIADVPKIETAAT